MMESVSKTFFNIEERALLLYKETFAEAERTDAQFEELCKLSLRQPAKSRAKKAHKIASLLFYAVMFFAFAAMLNLFIGTGRPQTFLGFSLFTVEGSSMQDEIPKDSLIIVKRTNAQKLKVGDNITFVTNNNITVTHKIIEIQKNYDSSGTTGFITKGVNNTNPDKDIVNEQDVIGKVLFVLRA